MTWVIAGVKCNFEPHQVHHTQPTSRPRRGIARHHLSGWSHSGCDGGDAKGGRPGMVHRVIRFLHCCGRRWWIVGKRLSVLVRVYQHLSCLLLRCAGWLLCQDYFISASWELTGNANRNPPTAAADQSLNNPLIYKPLFPQHLLVIFSVSCCLILSLTLPLLCFHLFGRDHQTWPK